MAISDRISSMEEHIKESYQELKGIGLDITGFNKNLENIPRLIDNYWETLPKVNGSGTDITLDNTKEGKMKIQLKGDTYQYSTTGKQLFNKDAEVLLTGHCTYTYSNGIYTITNTDTSNFSIDLALDLPAGSYILNSETSLSSATQIRDDLSSLYNFGNNYSNQSFTTSSTATRIRFNFATSATPITLNLNTLMISVNGGDYEPYTAGASPNPTYPQNVEVVTGEQNIKIQNKNLFVSNNITRFAFGSNSASPTGEQIVTASSYRGYALKVTAGQVISLSRISFSSNRFRYGFTKVYPVHATPLYNMTNKDDYLKVENISVPNGMEYLVLYLSNASQDNISDIQIELGSTSSEYTLHQEQNYEINLPVENLFNKATTNANKYLNVSDGNLSNSETISTSDYISIEGSKNYVISGYGTNNSYKVVCYYDNSKTFISADNVTNTKETYAITTPSTAKYLRFHYRNEVEDNMQLEKGTQANHYWAYGTTPIELCKIGEYQDYIYKSGGNWYKHKTIGKGTITSVNSVGTSSAGIKYAALGTVNNSISASKLYCSNYVYSTTATINNAIRLTATQTEGVSNLLVYDNRFTDTTTALNYLNGLNYYHPLATPIEEAITDETLIEQLNNFYYASSYEEQTNIASRGILATNMNANALEDTSN